MITREQQVATKELRASEEKWLRSYGWEPDGGRWRHPKVKIGCAFTSRDAIAHTEAHPIIGWPERRSG